MSRFRTITRRLGTQSNSDERGRRRLFGRECPVKECLGYFKITVGTGKKSLAPCHCPYCGHSGDSGTFFTQDQVEYIQSIALKTITDALHKDLKSLEFEHKPQGLFGIGFSLKIKESAPLPIRYYREKKLETEIVCDSLHPCGTRSMASLAGALTVGYTIRFKF